VTRVAVFIDWQNTYKTAREAFGWLDWPNEYGNYSPLSLGRDLACASDRGEAAHLVRVFVYRGLPSNRLDPAGYAANRRQSAAWMAEGPEVVVPKLRPLRYANAVIFSHDTDLLPAVDAMVRLRGASCVETASWVSPTFQSRLRSSGRVAHHVIDARQFARHERRVNYARPA
jgi:hypothetical protein